MRIRKTLIPSRTAVRPSPALTSAATRSILSKAEPARVSFVMTLKLLARMCGYIQPRIPESNGSQPSWSNDIRSFSHHHDGHQDPTVVASARWEFSKTSDSLADDANHALTSGRGRRKAGAPC